MPTVHYYGKKTNFIGKTLFEILANLRNFGVGRMVLKQEELLKNPGEKCYYIVKKVEPVMDEKLEEGAIYAEQVFRGAKVSDLVFIDDETWHTDWQLVPKSEEDSYRVDPNKLVVHGHPDTITLLPKWMEVPPLMDIFLRRHYKARNGAMAAPVRLDTKLINIRMHYNLEKMNRPNNFYRVAEDGEETVKKFNLPIKHLLTDQFKPNKTMIQESAKGYVNK